MTSPEYDDKTLINWQSDVDEYKELKRRKFWLLYNHPDFQSELKDIDQNSGKRLPLDLKEMVLDYEHLKTIDKHGTHGRKFVIKYDLYSSEPEGFSFEFSVLRNLARLGKWDNWKITTFDRHVWWFELNQNGKSDKEIVGITISNDNYQIFLELQALLYWKKEDPQGYQTLCTIAEKPADGQLGFLDKLYLFLHTVYPIPTILVMKYRESRYVCSRQQR